MKGQSIRYEPEELAWIEAHARDDRRSMHERFCALFRRADVSLSNLNALCKRQGWLTGRTGRFELGQEAHNKGKPMAFNPRSAATRFKPGQLPHNHRGAGHERIDSKDGYVIMIVAETNPWTGAATRPVHKHRWLWERQHGPIPAGNVLKCLDGDKTNTDPANWVLVPQALLPRLAAAKRGIAYDSAPTELKPTLLATAKLEHAARTARKKRTEGQK